MTRITTFAMSRHTKSQRHAVLMLAAAWLTACSPPPPEAPAPPAPEPALEIPDGPPPPEAVETGKDCVKAEAVCEGGVCTATVQNQCEEPVTCELEVLAICRGETDTGDARGKARDTIAAGQEYEMQAGADCQEKEVTATTVELLVCR
jgi:hypothetical protein